MITKAGQQFKHFKGNTYEVVAVAEHTENHKNMVVYFNVNIPDKIWVRPLKVFKQKLNPEKYPGATQEYRFQLVEPVEESPTEEPQTSPEPTCRQ